MVEPNAYQRGLVNKLLLQDFKGAEKLRKQFQNAEIEECNDEDDCGSFIIHPSKGIPPANVDNAIPVEGKAKDENGIPIEYLLHTRDGYLTMLEVVVYSELPLAKKIPLNDIDVLVQGDSDNVIQ